MTTPRDAASQIACPTVTAELPVDAAQQWFWTRRWQEREQEVDKHVAAGRVDVHDDVESFLTHVDAFIGT